MLLFSPVLCAIGWGSKEWPLVTHPFPNNIVWYEILLSSTYAETVLTLLYVHQTVVALGDMICCYFHLCCVLLAGEAQNGLQSSPKCQTTLYDMNFNKLIHILRLCYHSFVFFQSWLTIFVVLVGMVVWWCLCLVAVVGVTLRKFSYRGCLRSCFWN